ncbi:Protein of unknown function [Lactobacillus acidophilus DSM 9126]|nr:Protein of unknown function [Lactobacillus acidophilus DSM 20079 = JCM 1132 = NBRC 13951 = CIP 76.13]CDF69254.1 Protein of unknown function [Lactobacillus acidophilus CIRM-BIA 442]CDF71024.1 Protein of unknown function [Lactobacillus acidophilus CIRM-BIA 445]CDF72841.1 Protein of unknown function [Lactobacillus acidophilus DSM 9126]CDF74828.1 Protein of unknown function [Lactobacillus acidophilus DSM 20242]
MVRPTTVSMAKGFGFVLKTSI